MGKDGTLWDIQTDSPAAGHVHAKTGTLGGSDLLHHSLMITGKGIAGYISEWWRDRKSTRLNSSHLVISYAVFCLKKQTNLSIIRQPTTRPPPGRPALPSVFLS